MRIPASTNDRLEEFTAGGITNWRGKTDDPTRLYEALRDSTRSTRDTARRSFVQFRVDVPARQHTNVSNRRCAARVSGTEFLLTTWKAHRGLILPPHSVSPSSDLQPITTNPHPASCWLNIVCIDRARLCVFGYKLGYASIRVRTSRFPAFLRGVSSTYICCLHNDLYMWSPVGERAGGFAVRLAALASRVRTSEVFRDS